MLLMTIIVISSMLAYIPTASGGRKSALDFAEVEILLSDELNIESIRALPRAPGSDLEVLDRPSRVIVQLPATEVEALADRGADIAVLRRFILVEGSAGEAGSLDDPGITDCGCSGINRYGENYFDCVIPDDYTWICSPIPITEAPIWARVTCIEVEYYILFTFEQYLIVELTDEDETCWHRLWDHQSGAGGFIHENECTTTCNGARVNQEWYLCAVNDVGFGHGYIDWWWIKVYYGPPGNDDCTDAIPVTEGVPYAGTTYNATGTDQSSCGFNDTRDVWHSYTPATTHPVKISLAGSDFDTTLAVFASCGGTELACNDDAGTPQSEIEMDVTAPKTYFIRVAGHDGTAGNYTLTVTNPCVLAPDFDHNCDVDFKDLRELVLYWLQNEPSVNLAPPNSIIDFLDYAVLANYWGSYQP